MSVDQRADTCADLCVDERADTSVDRRGQRIGVAGAGLLGRLLAWQLGGLGHRVTVFDPASGPLSRDRAAGWAAAGMLSPWAELESADIRVAELGMRSLDRWAQIAAELHSPIDFRREGSLLLAHGSDLGAAKRVLGLLRSRLPAGSGPQALTEAQRARLEPAVHGPTLTWHLGGEGQVDTALAMQALADDATLRGACWRWEHTVRDIAPGRIDGEAFDTVFDVRGCGARPDLPVRGVRGEIAWLRAPGVVLNRPLRLLHPRWRVYLVPRMGDVIGVGATEIESEDRGPISVRSLLGLLSAAHSVLPDLAEARLLRTDTQLRPALPDNLPLAEHRPGLVRLNGLFRHGWLIAPALVDDALRDAGLDTPRAASVRVLLNGSPQPVVAGSALDDLIDALGHAPEAVATALNGDFVPRAQRPACRLREGDRVSFFQPIVGG